MARRNPLRLTAADRRRMSLDNRYEEFSTVQGEIAAVAPASPLRDFCPVMAYRTSPEPHTAAPQRAASTLALYVSSPYLLSTAPCRLARLIAAVPGSSGTFEIADTITCAREDDFGRAVIPDHSTAPIVKIEASAAIPGQVFELTIEFKRGLYISSVPLGGRWQVFYS